MENRLEALIGTFERELREHGFSNLDDPLFDLSDERLRATYQRLQADTEARAESRDTTSWDEILDCVGSHISRYGNGAVALISGAAPHIWGAIPRLEQEVGARYVSATSHKLGIGLMTREDLVIRWGEGTDEEKEQEALDKVRVQMTRNLCVARSLGYDTIEAFVRERSGVEEPKSVIFGMEETGLHSLYYGERKERLHRVVFDFVREVEPSSILYIGEDLFVESVRANFERGGWRPALGRPRDALFEYARSQRIPVDFGAFGIRDRRLSLDSGFDEIIDLDLYSEF